MKCISVNYGLIKVSLVTVLIIASFRGVPLFAQQPASIIPPSPDAAALGMYADLPVGTYTGIPDISIPLANIDYGEIHLPMNLSYHGSGIKVEEDASWVGLGWALNVGGVITRTVKGGSDMAFADDGISNLGIEGYQGYPYDIISGSMRDFLGQICEKQVDAEPDQFYFNFQGKSGSFVLERGQNRLDNFVTGTPLSVEKIDIKYDKSNHRWQIRTPDGYTYYFGTMELSEVLHGEIGSSLMQPEHIQFDPVTHGFFSNEDVVVSSWYLDKIVTPTGREVTYIYDVRDGSEVSGPTPAGVKFSLYGSARIDISEITRQLLQLPQFCVPPGEGAAATKTFTAHIYLKEIQHPLGKVVFNKSLREDILPVSISLLDPQFPYEYSSQGPVFMNWLLGQSGPQKLDNIQIFNNAGDKLKQIEFDYSYFNAIATGSSRYAFKRLKLLGTRQCGASECMPYHRFAYNEEYPLPSKYSYAQDFWGYYNGAQYNTSRIPTGSYYNPNSSRGPVIMYVGTADRQPNGKYMTSGTINKITYPTGGSSEFQFEPHDYFTFGSEAFAITDFKKNDPVPMADLSSDGTGQTYRSTFTVTDVMQELIFDEFMRYLTADASGDICHVTDPGQIYFGSEPWYSLRNINTGVEEVHYMSDYLNYFSQNRLAHCTGPSIPSDPFSADYTHSSSVMVGPGTYELSIYSRREFMNIVTVTKKSIPSRTIEVNEAGVFAKTAGGLRIKSIVSKEGASSASLTKSYDYTSTSSDGRKSSTGRLMLFPTYHVLNACYDLGMDDPFVTPEIIIGRSWANVPLGTSARGSIVGYDRVTERTLDAAGNPNGRTEYSYINHEEELIETQVFIEGFPTRKNTENGLLEDLKKFDGAGNVVFWEHNEYTRQMLKTFPGTIIKYMQFPARFPVHIPCTERGRIWLSYDVVSDRWANFRTTRREYSRNSSSVYSETVTEYDYDTQTHLQVNSERTTSSKKEILITNYTYPNGASWIPSAMWQDKFIYTPPVQITSTRSGSPVMNSKKYYGLVGNTYLMNKEEYAAGTSSLETNNTITYTSTGNIRTVTSRDGVTILYLWGYKDSYPVAEIRNATLQQVLTAMGNITESALNAFALSPQPTSQYANLVNSVRTGLPGAQITSFAYDPIVGIQSVMDPAGIVTSYEYDTFKRLAVIRDNGGNILKTINYNYRR